MNRVSGHDDIDNLLNVLAAAPTREEIIQWFKENLSWALNSAMIQGFRNLAAWALRPDIMHWLVLAASPMVGVIAALVTWRILKAHDAARVRTETIEAEPKNWHAWDSGKVFELLAADPKGLNADEVRRRLGVYGPNRLPEVKTRGPLARFLAQFQNLLIYVLLGVAATTAAPYRSWVWVRIGNTHTSSHRGEVPSIATPP